MTTVTLKIKTDEGTKKEQFEIESIDAYQLEAALGAIRNVLKIVENNQHLKDMFMALADDGLADDEQGDQDFVTLAVRAFELLLVEIPNEAFRLLSILSGIDYDILMRQKALDIPDIFDAVIEENDLEKLVTRVKKSFASTKIKMGWLTKLRKVTGQQK